MTCDVDDFKDKDHTLYLYTQWPFGVGHLYKHLCSFLVTVSHETKMI